MEQQDQDITIALAVTGVIGVAIGCVVGSRWRKRQLGRKMDVYIAKMQTIQNLQLDLAQWMAENVNTMDHAEYLERLNGKTEYLRIVSEELAN